MKLTVVPAKVAKDGTVELHSVAPINPNLRNIEELESVLKKKDEVIKAKDDFIGILKNK